MPLMMDPSINVDDLFGEPASIELGLSSASTKGLAQRLDEMRLLGCCRKVAWSRLGCIAYISRDGLRVNVRHLHCRPSDGKWMLSDDTPLVPVTEAHGGHQLVHVCWNETGAELAVVDSSGRVSIYSISIALNSIAGQRQATYDPDDEANQIVGMMWLNMHRSVHAFYQAAKVNNRWAYSPFRRRPIGPFHPANKAAVICVTRSGMIKLLYQNPDSRWTEISAELKNTGYSDRLLTHAALVATQSGIIITTHSLCQKISVYRVHISWNPPQWDPSLPKQSNLFPVPSFRFTHCNVEIPSNVWNVNRSSGESPDESQPSTNALYSLTNLEVILGAVDNPSGATSNPWILAVYSSPPHAAPNHPERPGAASIIVRWQLDSATQSLHPKFDEVASKKNNNSQTKPKMELRRLEDIHLQKYVVSVDQTEYGNVLAITHDDSSITFYDPKTMAVFNGMDDNNTVTCLAQAGFNSSPEIPGLHISFSPSACIAVMLDSEGQMQLRPMEHSYGSENGVYDEAKFSSAIAALTLAFCRGCGSDINTDDILTVVIRQLSSDSQVAFLNEVYRALPINCNFTVEQDKLMNHPYIPRCLSIQAALGFRDRYRPRTLAAAVPWATLHLRHAAVLFAYFFQYNKGAQTEPHDPDVLRMVLGNAKWALEFSQYILNEVFDLADEFEGVLSDQEALAQKLKSTNSLPLILLLSSMSRTFLRFICRGLRGVYAGYANATALMGDSRIYYSEICHILDTSPIRIDMYEKLLAGIDSAIRHSYHGAGFGDTERPGPEKELLVIARIPPVLVTAVSNILGTVLPPLRNEVDRMAIYLGDYTWLGVGDDQRSEMYRRTRDVDILKKTPLRAVSSSDAGSSTKPGNNLTGGAASSGQRHRRCVRCCEISGDTKPPRSMLSFHMIARLTLLRSCICGGMWALESSDHGSSITTTTGSSSSGTTTSPGIHQDLARTPGLMQGS